MKIIPTALHVFPHAHGELAIHITSTATSPRGTVLTPEALSDRLRGALIGAQLHSIEDDYEVIPGVDEVLHIPGLILKPRRFETGWSHLIRDADRIADAFRLSISLNDIRGHVAKVSTEGPSLHQLHATRTLIEPRGEVMP